MQRWAITRCRLIIKPVFPRALYCVAVPPVQRVHAPANDREKELLDLCALLDYEGAADAFHRLDRPSSVACERMAALHFWEGELSSILELWERTSALGIPRSAVMYNYAIRAHVDKGSKAMWDVVRQMRLEGVTPTSSTYEPVVHQMCCEHDVGNVYKVIKEMEDQRVTLSEPVCGMMVLFHAERLEDTAMLGWMRLKSCAASLTARAADAVGDFDEYATWSTEATLTIASCLARAGRMVQAESMLVSLQTVVKPPAQSLAGSYALPFTTLASETETMAWEEDEPAALELPWEEEQYHDLLRALVLGYAAVRDAEAVQRYTAIARAAGVNLDGDDTGDIMERAHTSARRFLESGHPLECLKELTALMTKGVRCSEHTYELVARALQRAGRVEDMSKLVELTPSHAHARVGAVALETGLACHGKALLNEGMMYLRDLEEPSRDALRAVLSVAGRESRPDVVEQCVGLLEAKRMPMSLNLCFEMFEAYEMSLAHRYAPEELQEMARKLGELLHERGASVPAWAQDAWLEHAERRAAIMGVSNQAHRELADVVATTRMTEKSAAVERVAARKFGHKEEEPVQKKKKKMIKYNMMVMQAMARLASSANPSAEEIEEFVRSTYIVNDNFGTRLRQELDKMVEKGSLKREEGDRYVFAVPS